LNAPAPERDDQMSTRSGGLIRHVEAVGRLFPYRISSGW
jgi:hypothetical protein